MRPSVHIWGRLRKKFRLRGVIDIVEFTLNSKKKKLEVKNILTERQERNMQRYRRKTGRQAGKRTETGTGERTERE